MTKWYLSLTIILAACGSHVTARLPEPKTLLRCFTVEVRDSARKLQLPRALNLGTAKRGEGQLHVGTLVPHSAEVLALWRFTSPDSLTIDLVPAASGVAVMSGIRLLAQLSDSVVIGRAVFWTDLIGGEISTPFSGRLVPCPAGA